MRWLYLVAVMNLDNDMRHVLNDEQDTHADT
jgi:hypothetical protein